MILERVFAYRIETHNKTLLGDEKKASFETERRL